MSVLCSILVYFNFFFLSFLLNLILSLRMGRRKIDILLVRLDVYFSLNLLCVVEQEFCMNWFSYVSNTLLPRHAIHPFGICETIEQNTNLAFFWRWMQTVPNCWDNRPWNTCKHQQSSFFLFWFPFNFVNTVVNSVAVVSFLLLE